jgi:hypothetical protein
MAEVYLVPGIFGAGGQILDSNGKPAAGALITVYAAGTTTPATVYTTAAGNVTAANPVVCGADGRLPYELWQPVGQAIKIVLTDAVSSTLGTYDNLKGINDPLAISGVALLSAANVFANQINNFSNITAKSIQVTSIFASSMTVSSLTVSNLLTVSSLNVSGIVVSTITSNSITVSNLTVSGGTANLNGLRIGRTVTGAVVNANMIPGSIASSLVTHGMGTDQVQILISVKASVDKDFVAWAARNDNSITIYRGYSCTTTANPINIGASSTAAGVITIGVFNSSSSTQTVTANYMVIG